MDKESPKGDEHAAKSSNSVSTLRHGSMAASCLLAAFLLQAFLALPNLSATADEALDLASGYSFGVHCGSVPRGSLFVLTEHAASWNARSERRPGLHFHPPDALSILEIRRQALVVIGLDARTCSRRCDDPQVLGRSPADHFDCSF